MLGDQQRLWFDQMHWGVTGCRLFVGEGGEPCWRPAELLWDCGELERGVPACLQCVERLLERRQALAEGADASRLPPLRTW